MLCGFLLLVFSCSIKPHSLYLNVSDTDVVKTKVLMGYIETHDGTLVFTHMPAGNYPNTVVYKHQMMFQTQEQKLVAEKAKNKDHAVKVVGKLAAINGSHFIIVDTIKLLDFEGN